ncbi:MAG: DNA polymerase III subunit delta [Bacteroidia bacterium]
MEITFEKLMREMQENKYRPAYLLHGEEPYFIDNVCKYIEENSLTEAEKAFNFTVVYGKDVNIDAIVSQAQQFPMMGQRQVVIVKEAQSLRNLDGLIGYLENPVNSTLLVIAHKVKSLNKTSKIYKKFKEKAAVMESKPMKDWQLKKWLPGFLKDNYKLAIEPQAVEFLVEFQGTEVQKLMNEISKINIKKDLTTITGKMVQENIGFGKDFDIFEVQDALASRNKKTLTRIVKYFETIMKPGDIIGINSILYRYFSQAYAISVSHKKKDELFKEMGISEWHYKKIKIGIDHYGYKLKDVLKIVKEYDLRSKGVNSVNVAPAELLKEMLFKIVTL